MKAKVCFHGATKEQDTQMWQFFCSFVMECVWLLDASASPTMPTPPALQSGPGKHNVTWMVLVSAMN